MSGCGEEVLAAAAGPRVGRGPRGPSWVARLQVAIRTEDTGVGGAVYWCFFPVLLLAWLSVYAVYRKGVAQTSAKGAVAPCIASMTVV